MQPTPKHVVLISKIRHKPEITIHVTDESLEIRLPLADFLTELVAEMGSPALLLSRAALATRLESAAQRVVRTMKYDTARAL